MTCFKRGRPRGQTLFDEICRLLKEAGLDLKGLFLKADPGFDSAEFVTACGQEEIIANVKENSRNSAHAERVLYQTGTHVFDGELYRDRSVIEHANAWIDGFKALLVRFEFSVKNWMSLHFIAFAIIFLRKIKQVKRIKRVGFHVIPIFVAWIGQPSLPTYPTFD